MRTAPTFGLGRSHQPAGRFRANSIACKVLNYMTVSSTCKQKLAACIQCFARDVLPAERRSCSLAGPESSPMKLLEKRSERLRAGLSSTLAQLRDEPSPKRVHRLRTTIRRIESLVAFAEPQLGRKQERAIKDLAALRRRAGRVREMYRTRNVLVDLR